MRQLINNLVSTLSRQVWPQPLRSPGSKTLDSSSKRVIAKQLYRKSEPPFCGAGLHRGCGHTCLIMLLVFFNYLPLSSKKVPDKICAASLEAHDLIKNLEGFRPEAYVKADQWLIGYGFAQYPSGAMPKAGDTISRERADEILVHEVNKISNYIAKLIQAPVSQNQFDALVSFAYSVGVGRFRDSTLLRKLNSEDYEATAQEFKRWVHINGEVSPGLVKRRERELGLFGDQ